MANGGKYIYYNARVNRETLDRLIKNEGRDDIKILAFLSNGKFNIDAKFWSGMHGYMSLMNGCYHEITEEDWNESVDLSLPEEQKKENVKRKLEPNFVLSNSQINEFIEKQPNQENSIKLDDTLPDFRVGDEVYVPLKGKIESITDSDGYPIRVLAEGKIYHMFFDKKGRDNNGITLLSFTPWDPVNGGLSQVRPIGLKEGDLIFVRFPHYTDWEMAYFAHVDGDIVFVFDDQKKEGTVSCVSEWSIENPLK